MTKRLTNGFCLICIFLCAAFSGNSQPCQSDWVEKADALYASGMYTDAAIGYERAVFDGLSGSRRDVARCKKANCYKQMGKFTEALRELDRIILPSLTDSFRSTVIHQKVLCYYLQHNLQEARSWFDQLPETYRPVDIQALEILISSGLYDWETAKQQTINLIQSTTSGQRQDSLMRVCNTLFKKNALPVLKKEKTAALLSTFLPGAGQVYTGYPGRGFLAFTFTAGTIGMAVAEILHGYYITGYLTGLGFFQKFYFGGIEQSRRLTAERNSRSLEKHTLAVRNLVFSCIETDR